MGKHRWWQRRVVCAQVLMANSGDNCSDKQVLWRHTRMPQYSSLLNSFMMWTSWPPTSCPNLHPLSLVSVRFLQWAEALWGTSPPPLASPAVPRGNYLSWLLWWGACVNTASSTQPISGAGTPPLHHPSPEGVSFLWGSATSPPPPLRTYWLLLWFPIIDSVMELRPMTNQHRGSEVRVGNSGPLKELAADDVINLSLHCHWVLRRKEHLS